MRTGQLLRIPPIKADLIPPRDPLTGESAKPTGEMWTDREGTAHVVYSMSMPDLVKTAAIENRKPVIDPETQEQATRKNDTGDRYRVWHRPTVFEKRDFILERSPGGEVRIQTDFRPDPEDIERAKEAKATERFQTDLAKEAVKRGLTAGQLVEAMLGKTADAKPDPADFEIVRVSRGWYNVKAKDGTMMSERSLRKADAEILLGEVNGVLAGMAPGDDY